MLNMTNDAILKALSALTPDEVKEIIESVKNAEANQTQPLSTTATLDNTQSAAEVISNAFETADSFAQASFDRQCLREFLDAQAQAQARDGLPTEPCFAELHRWWDGTSYKIFNDWLFTDDQFIVVDLQNASGESKSFRLRVSAQVPDSIDLKGPAPTYRLDKL